ncbi:MAG: hypothetical protein Q9220_005523 [cf. Caloplaca sp. 1 TL-2023]
MSRNSPFFSPGATASADSLAILHLKRDLLNPTLLRTYDDEDLGYAEGKVSTTRYGNYPHSTLIGQSWGSQIKASQVDTGTRGRVGLNVGGAKKRKRGGSVAPHRDGNSALEIDGDEDLKPKEPRAAVPAQSGFCHLLPPTPEAWTASLPHRTQVVYTPDYSYILQRLRVNPGTHIIEAGAGSGSFTHAAARAVFNGYPSHNATNELHVTVPPSGKVWSFEFHDQRAQKIQAEIQEHGLDDIVTVTHRDVYQDGFAVPSTGSPASINASAIFLDLPAPWLALRHISRGSSSPLNPSRSAHICTFSPCIEQVQRTVAALRSLGWLDIETVEIAARRLEVRRERVGLHEEGLRGVNASPATVEEAVGRLREVEGSHRSYHHGSTTKAQNGSHGPSTSEHRSNQADGQEEDEYVSKQQRIQSIQASQADRRLYKEGRLVHRSEPELKTHTSYLVFAILPRTWTEEDERKAQEATRSMMSVQTSSSEKPVSKRQMKRDLKEQAGGNKDLELETKWQMEANSRT